MDVGFTHSPRVGVNLTGVSDVEPFRTNIRHDNTAGPFNSVSIKKLSPGLANDFSNCESNRKTSP